MYNRKLIDIALISIKSNTTMKRENVDKQAPDVKSILHTYNQMTDDQLKKTQEWMRGGLKWQRSLRR